MMLGQVGRAVGPLLATWVFDTAQRVVTGPGSGMNWSRIYILMVGSPAFFLCVPFFEDIYGRWSDLSPMQKRLDKTGEESATIQASKGAKAQASKKISNQDMM